MAERSPAIQFYFRQFSGDDQVQAMELDEIGAHILLICAAGASEERYRLPNEERLLRKICRNISAGKFARIFSNLKKGAWKISDDGQWIEQVGLYRSFMQQKEFSDNQREKANARWDAAASVRHPSGNALHLQSSTSSTNHKKNQESLPESHQLERIWQEEHGQLPAIHAMSKERLSRCRSRIASHASNAERFLVEFRAAVRHAAGNVFLLGADGGWKASFDWFVANDTNYLKVLEGKYDSAKTPAYKVPEARVGSSLRPADVGVSVRPEVLQRIREREEKAREAKLV